jgi:hypothetical protein
MNNNEIVDMLQAYFGNNRNYYLQRNATWKPPECHAKCLEQNGAQFEQISWKKIIVILYSSIISSNYVFKGLAFETLGPWCKEAIDFINVIGNRLIAESGDSKSKKFLFERISLAIQRGNAASIRGTFPDSAILSEIFVL